MFIDTHAHLQDKAFEKDLNDTIIQARKNGVGIIVIPGTDMKTSKKAIEIANSNVQIFAATGYHPHDAKKFKLNDLEILESMFSQNVVVAFGEIGLDFHYDFSPRDTQKSVLREQLKLAKKIKKPLILHSRESQRELISILEQEEAYKLGGVVHCFSGNIDEALKFVEMGFYIGFTGVVTYKNADMMRDVAKVIPLERILVETDAPYLAPNRERGKRNEPKNIPVITEKLAEIRKISVNEMSEILLDNAKNLFKFPIISDIINK